MKVALVGTEETSRGYTPWDDLSWKIWACSEACIRYPRVDEIFELHNLEWYVQQDPEKAIPFISGLAETSAKVWVARPFSALPNALPLPREKLVVEFGPYFFTSTVAWMMAKAILDGATEIGLFGISMTASSEYAYQRPGCQYFLQICKNRCIRVSAPLEADILQPPPQYGFREFEPFFRKMHAAKQAAVERLNANRERQKELMLQEQRYYGALERIEYDMHTFSLPEPEKPTVLQIVEKVKAKGAV